MITRCGRQKVLVTPLILACRESELETATLVEVTKQTFAS